MAGWCALMHVVCPRPVRAPRSYYSMYYVLLCTMAGTMAEEGGRRALVSTSHNI